MAKKISKKVRVAIIGVGNCASSLVQGVEFYKDAKVSDRVPGLMHVNLGGYHIRDIEFSAAFDVVDGKVGLDLSEAIFAPPNNTYKFTSVPKLGVNVDRGRGAASSRDCRHWRTDEFDGVDAAPAAAAVRLGAGEAAGNAERPRR